MVACLLRGPIGEGLKPSSEVREFGTQLKDLVALARILLVIIYTMLKTNSPYDEQKFSERKTASEQRRVKRMVNEITRLGCAVSMPA